MQAQLSFIIFDVLYLCVDQCDLNLFITQVIVSLQKTFKL